MHNILKDNIFKLVYMIIKCDYLIWCEKHLIKQIKGQVKHKIHKRGAMLVNKNENRGRLKHLLY